MHESKSQYMRLRRWVSLLQSSRMHESKYCTVISRNSAMLQSLRMHESKWLPYWSGPHWSAYCNPRACMNQNRPRWYLCCAEWIAILAHAWVKIPDSHAHTHEQSLQSSRMYESKCSLRPIATPPRGCNPRTCMNQNIIFCLLFWGFVGCNPCACMNQNENRYFAIA